MSHIEVVGDDVNRVVFKYLLEQGYKHAAFALEHEAKLDCEDVLRRKIPPRYLLQLLEQALLLQYMENHAEQDENHLCTAPLSLLAPHTCDVTERNLLGKRALIRQSNLEIAKEINESLVRIDHEIPMPTGPMQLADERLPQIPSAIRAKSSGPTKPVKSIEERKSL